MIIRQESVPVSFPDMTELPKMDGTASAGTSPVVARADHVHPSDTTRAAKSHRHIMRFDGYCYDEESDPYKDISPV